MKYLKKAIPALCLALLIMLMPGAVVAEAASERAVTERELKVYLPIENKDTYSYPTVSLYLSGNYINERAYLINDTTYVPLRAAMEFIGARIIYDASVRTAYLYADGLEMSVSDGAYTVYANGRPLMSRTPAVILSDGRMYIPVRTLAKVLGLSVEWKAPSTVRLDGRISVLTHADDYYKSDEVLWLSRIINAESRGEPLLGQIAVGNVVLNRVRSDDYPPTIYGVIFDRKHGVQFSPVNDGSIYLPVTYTSLLAAKICLEGFSISPDILFFMEPRKSVSKWIIENRPYEFTIGNHYFFS